MAVSIIIKIGTIFLNIIYGIMKLFPIKNQVVMISRQANEPSIDFKLLQKALHEQDSSIQVVMLCHTLDGGVQSSIMNKIKYCFHMLKQMYVISRSKVVVLDTYCIVISLLKHRKNLKVIQMWHSIGSMKKFGYTALDTEEGTKSKMANLMQMHKNYTYVLASSVAYQKDLAKGFNCDESIVKIYPLPRVDVLRDEQYRIQKKAEILQYYPALKNKQIIVYVPTFRKKEDEMQKAFDALCNALNDHQILVLKPHPLSKLKITNEKAIEVPKYSSFDMLFAADAIISDYSCIVYEAGLIGTPLYFYNFDMDHYLDRRGLAIDYENELPGVISKNPQTIIDAIERNDYDYDKLHKFIDKYVQCDGSASANIASFIRNIMEEGCK